MSTTTGLESTDEHAQPYDASGSGMPRETIGLRRIGDFTLTWGESLRWDDRRERWRIGRSETLRGRARPTRIAVPA